MFNKLKLAIKALMLKAIDRVLVNELYMAYHGDKFYYIIWDLDQYLRNHIKYNPDKLSAKQIDILDKTRDKLYELLDGYDVDFNHVE